MKAHSKPWKWTFFISKELTWSGVCIPQWIKTLDEELSDPLEYLGEKKSENKKDTENKNRKKYRHLYVGVMG